MRIAIGADQGGFELKSVDYPDIAGKVARAVAAGEVERGIAICGTGIGVSMKANKVPGIRAALCTNAYRARMAREHNDAQVLCLGGWIIGSELAKDIVQIFLAGKFSGGRHARRVRKINALDRKE
jgi:ribose 5-phosphate isomerase B